MFINNLKHPWKKTPKKNNPGGVLAGRGWQDSSRIGFLGFSAGKPIFSLNINAKPQENQYFHEKSMQNLRKINIFSKNNAKPRENQYFHWN